LSLLGPQIPAMPVVPQLYLVQNLVFKNQTIPLDGYHFKNCAFVDCTLYVKVGNFRFEEVFFQGNWWCTFDGNALTVTRLNSILDSTKAPAGLRAHMHPNGGITII
jgi:hypothetical protein